jgi:hypothetical protein
MLTPQKTAQTHIEAADLISTKPHTITTFIPHLMAYTTPQTTT